MILFNHLDYLIAVKNGDIDKVIDILLMLEKESKYYGYKAFLFKFLIQYATADQALKALQKLQYPPVAQLVNIVLMTGSSEQILRLKDYQKTLIKEDM